MQLTTLFVASLPVLGAFAFPGKHCSASTVTETVPVTATVTNTYTKTVTETTSIKSSSTSPTSSPSSLPAPSGLTVMALRSASPIHFLQMTASGQRFYLGGNTSTYCPASVGASCPPGNVTALAGLCSMSVEVPGGQLIYATPEGEIGYTQAHSAYYPTGSVLCPFTYYKDPASTQPFGYLSTSAFGATGLMACPTTTGGWQVFAAIQNATVPTGKVSDCLGFDAAAIEFDDFPAAWQYT